MRNTSRPAETNAAILVSNRFGSLSWLVIGFQRNVGTSYSRRAGAVQHERHAREVRHACPVAVRIRLSLQPYHRHNGHRPAPRAEALTSPLAVVGGRRWGCRIRPAHAWQSTATANAAQISRIRASASRPSRSTSTPRETLSTESRLTAERLGTGSSPGSRTTSLGRARIVVVHAATSVRPSLTQTCAGHATSMPREGR